MPIVPAGPSAPFDKFHCFLTNGLVSRTPSVADLVILGGWKESTLNGYNCAVKKFLKFCATCNEPLGALPISGETLKRFCVWAGRNAHTSNAGKLKDYINVTSDWISYALIDDITDAFGPLIQGIEYEVDSIDELVLILKDVEQSDMLRRIGTCRKKVMGLLRLMGNKADVVKGLAKRCNENWSVAPKSDIGLYLSDIQDHLVTMTQNLNHYEKILSRSHSNYLAQISIEMTDANNQINDVLSKLTALGSILVPMNLVTGLWGMNVHVPGQDVAEGYAWFIAIVCALVSFGVVGAWLTLRYFKFSNH
ncbi:hypothetical protein PtB15_17B72 [Puccinia triticina]|nr:hypothetical protein PtB15_17B72 [Puccinia triticina]